MVPCWTSTEERTAALASAKLAIIAKSAVGSAMPRLAPGEGAEAAANRDGGHHGLIDLRRDALEGVRDWTDSALDARTNASG